MNTIALSPARIRTAYRDACRLDVAAMKPGNVSEGAPGHNMTADDFHRSADASSDILARPGLTLGARIRLAVAATHARVGCNTNLGILLLCAPLAQACLARWEEKDLRNALRRVLSETNIADTDQVFAAIRVANPGGLGASERHDAREPARATLGEVMAEAAGRDRIAHQYATGFADLFEVAAPALAHARDRLRDEGAAITELFLHLLSRFPDSHLQRKHGDQAAARVSELASHALTEWRAEPPDNRGERLCRLDADLKRDGFNPGTTADLTVATLFMDRLLTPADQPAGSSRRQNLRYLRLTLCGAPLISTLTI